MRAERRDPTLQLRMLANPRGATLPSVFREVGVRGFPVRRTTAHDAALPERYDCPRSATSRAKSPAARASQHVTVSGVVPAH